MSDVPVTQTYAEELFARLHESGAVNYLQDTIEVTVEGDPTFDVIVILQHKGKPSPHELRMQAEAQVEELKGLLNAPWNKKTSPQQEAVGVITYGGMRGVNTVVSVGRKLHELPIGTSLYTHANPSEVEQKLAEAKALLRDARGCVQDSANNANCTANERLYSSMLSDMDAFLSAQPAACQCSEGKCQQWYLASDEVDDSCRSGRIVGMPKEMAAPYGSRLADETGECMVGP